MEANLFSEYYFPEDHIPLQIKSNMCEKNSAEVGGIIVTTMSAHDPEIIV